MTHPSHDTYISDSSLYDERCRNCGATDRAGSVDLLMPCPKTNKAEYIAALRSQKADNVERISKELLEALDGSEGCLFLDGWVISVKKGPSRKEGEDEG